jgi:hypothetical protein
MPEQIPFWDVLAFLLLDHFVKFSGILVPAPLALTL